MDRGSRGFWCKQTTETAGNEDTGFVPAAGSFPWGGPEALFAAHYQAMRCFIEEPRPPGLVLIAVDAGGLQAKAYLRAPETGLRTAILGRHGRCEIVLGNDPLISLRHLAVLLTPDLGFRLVDLRTAAGFFDGEGMSLRSVAASETLFIRCGATLVFVAPVGGGRPAWPDAPEVMWTGLEGRCASRYALPHPSVPEDGLVAEDEEPCGELSVSSAEGMGKTPVGRRAVRAGVLLGRSDRCDGDFLLTDPHISRVHLLVIEVAGALYAVDTASKNGVWKDAREPRAIRLESGTSLSLCGRATVSWRFFH